MIVWLKGLVETTWNSHLAPDLVFRRAAVFQRLGCFCNLLSTVMFFNVLEPTFLLKNTLNFMLPFKVFEMQNKGFKCQKTTGLFKRFSKYRRLFLTFICIKAHFTENCQFHHGFESLLCPILSIHPLRKLCANKGLLIRKAFLFSKI